MGPCVLEEQRNKPEKGRMPLIANSTLWFPTFLLVMLDIFLFGLIDKFRVTSFSKVFRYLFFHVARTNASVCECKTQNVERRVQNVEGVRREFIFRQYDGQVLDATTGGSSKCG